MKKFYPWSWRSRSILELRSPPFVISFHRRHFGLCRSASGGRRRMVTALLPALLLALLGPGLASSQTPLTCSTPFLRWIIIQKVKRWRPFWNIYFIMQIVPLQTVYMQGGDQVSSFISKSVKVSVACNVYFHFQLRIKLQKSSLQGHNELPQAYVQQRIVIYHGGRTSLAIGPTLRRTALFLVNIMKTTRRFLSQ